MRKSVQKTEQETEQEVKEPKTIKVSTVAIIVTVIVIAMASFWSGWVMRSADQARVQNEASTLAETYQLKVLK